MPKTQITHRSGIFRVRGVKADPIRAQRLSWALKNGFKYMVLRPEPENQHDPNAIKVMLAKGRQAVHVGYIPRELAAVVCGDPHRLRIMWWQVLTYHGKAAGLEAGYTLKE